jgi:undecaprenyl-diphosphatase
MRMNAGWITAGCVGVAALGTLLYRTYKHEIGSSHTPRVPDQRSRLINKVAQLRGTMPPVRRPRVHDLKDKGTRMNRPTTLTEADTTAARPPRVSRWFASLPVAILLGLIVLALVLPGDYRITTTLGIVQGLGEFLPISSSAHLILTPWLFGWDDPNSFFNSQAYDVALHVGTLLALIGFFGRDWIRLVLHAAQPTSPDGRLFWLIVIASLPGAAIGFVLDRFAADFFRDKELIIATALAVMGVILYYVDRVAPQRDDLEHLTWGKALLVGLAQALAFIPGVSRSGSTMTMGRALGVQRETAARFSFLMAMPITFGAALLKVKDINGAALRLPAFWLGIGISFVVGVLAIGFLLRYLRRNSFLPFVIYRIGLAAVVFAVYLLRG